MNNVTLTIGNITKNGEPCKNPLIKIIGYNNGIAFPCGDKVDKNGEIQLSIPEDTFVGSCIRGVIQCEDCDHCFKEFEACLCEKDSDCKACEDCINGVCVDLCPNGDCIDGKCVEECPEGFKWRNNECVCDGKIDEYGRCVECVDGDTKPCFYCDNGVWTPKDCGSRVCVNDECVCPPGTVYDFELDECVKAPCEPGTCPECQECVAGQCQDVVCPNGMVCVGDKCVEECDCQNPSCSDKGAACVQYGDICYCKECEGDCENGCSDDCYCNGDDCVPNPCSGSCVDGTDCGYGCGCLDGECVPCDSLPCGQDCSEALGCECVGNRCGYSDDPCAQYSCDDNCGDRPDCECVDGNCESKPCDDSDFEVKLNKDDCNITVELGGDICCPCPKIVLDNKIQSVTMGQDMTINTLVEVRKDVRSNSNLPTDAVDGVINRVSQTTYPEILQDEEMTSGVVEILVQYKYKKYQVKPDGSNSSTYQNVTTNWELLTTVDIVNGDSFNKSITIKQPGKTYGDKQYDSATIKFTAKNVKNSRSGCTYEETVIGSYIINKDNLSTFQNMWIAAALENDSCAKPSLLWYKGKEGSWDELPFRKVYVDGNTDSINNPWLNPMFTGGNPVDNHGDLWSNYEYKVVNSCGCNGNTTSYLEACANVAFFCDPKDISVEFVDCGKTVKVTENFKVNCEVNKNLNKGTFAGNAQQKETAQVKYQVWLNGEMHQEFTPNLDDIIIPNGTEFSKDGEPITSFEVKINHDYCEECVILKENEAIPVEIPDYNIDCRDGYRSIKFPASADVTWVNKPSGVDKLAGNLFVNIPDSIEEGEFLFDFGECSISEDILIPMQSCCEDLVFSGSAGTCGGDINFTYDFDMFVTNAELSLEIYEGSTKVDTITITGNLDQDSIVIPNPTNADVTSIKYAYNGDGICGGDGEVPVISEIARSIVLGTSDAKTYCEIPTGSGRPTVSVTGAVQGEEVIIRVVNNNSTNTYTLNYSNQFKQQISLSLGDTTVEIIDVNSNKPCPPTVSEGELTFNVTGVVELENLNVTFVGCTSVNGEPHHEFTVEVTTDPNINQTYVLQVYNTTSAGQNDKLASFAPNYNEVETVKVPTQEGAGTKYTFRVDAGEGCFQPQTLEYETAMLVPCDIVIFPFDTECHNDTSEVTYTFSTNTDPDTLVAYYNSIYYPVTGSGTGPYSFTAPNGTNITVDATKGSFTTSETMYHNCECNYITGVINLTEGASTVEIYEIFDNDLDNNTVYNFLNLGDTIGFNAQLDTMPGTFKWKVYETSDGSNYTLTSTYNNNLPITITNNPALEGGYVEVVINEGTLCEQSYQIYFNYTACENAANVTIEYDNSAIDLCDGDNLMVTNTNVQGVAMPYTRQWYGDGQPISGATGATLNTANAYSNVYVVITKGDCDYIGPNVPVSLITVPTPVVTQGACQNGNRLLSISNAGQYSAGTWTDGVDNAQYNQTLEVAPGTTSIDFTNLQVGSCTKSFTISVDVVECCQGTVELSQPNDCDIVAVNNNLATPVSYVWTYGVTGTENNSGETTNTFSISDLPDDFNGVVQVEATDSNGCVVTDTINISNPVCNTQTWTVDTGGQGGLRIGVIAKDDGSTCGNTDSSAVFSENSPFADDPTGNPLVVGYIEDCLTKCGVTPTVTYDYDVTGDIVTFTITGSLVEIDYISVYLPSGLANISAVKNC